MSEDSLRIKILEPAQYDEWDQFVSRSEQGSIFCYSWWLDAATKSNFKIYTVLEKNEIVAGFPAPLDNRNLINEPPLTRTLGILYRPQSEASFHKQLSNQRRWLTALLEHITLANFVQICMHHTISDWLPFRWRGFKQTTRYTYLIDYKQNTIGDLYNNLDRLKKRMIKRAALNMINTMLTDDISLVHNYVSLAYERQGLKFRIPIDEMRVLDEAIVRNGNRIIIKADDGSKVHSVLYAVYDRKSAYCLLSGSDPALRRLGGHTLVMWETITFFSDKVDYLNMGGSDIKPIEEHIRGFGGVMTPYFHIYNDRLIHYTEIRYHLKEMLFHMNSIFKAIRMRFLAN